MPRRCARSPDLGRIAADYDFTADYDFAVGATAPATGDDADVDFVSRFFEPGVGIPEDLVTDSAHSTLTPYWTERLGKTAMRARQVSARGGELRVELTGDRVLIGGRVVEVIEGTMTIS
jgi:predicted PhzF superfamily epimerase YddE/YHI9